MHQPGHGTFLSTVWWLAEASIHTLWPQGRPVIRRLTAQPPDGDPGDVGMMLPHALHFEGNGLCVWDVDGVCLSTGFEQTECVDREAIQPPVLDERLEEIRHDKAYLVPCLLETQPQRSLGLHIAARADC